MSKHPSNTIKQRLLRRGLAGILSLALLLGLLPGGVVAASAASWADPYVNTLVDWGVMRGDIGGNMAPNRSITRAEFVTMMNRAYGYTRLGGHPFTDVRNRDWYNQDIDIAYNIGYFKGTGPTTASPNDTLTREQAAVLLARNMMLQETVGETLGFSDSRTLSDWSRGLVGAAAANGIISGYDDGSFQPFRNITRGEVAAMLVRAIGTPIQTPGDHALGNVYGNVTVNTSGVKLRDGVIVGNLYLTGGIDLGDVLLENVTVLGEIIVSGGGESNSSQSSIILRNVTADSMVVDSIGSQFVTIRAEGDTDIPTTTVRTNAFVDDSSLPGYGLSHIVLDGEDGALYQLAGNIKEVINKTPGSSMQFVQGTANKATVDENAIGSSVLVDGDAVVDELNLDTATTVTGTGDIGNLNVGAAGSTVEQLPDKIEIRPGIDADINGSEMNSSQAAESSSEPKLLAGYPAVRKIAPTNAELVFRTNKTGTVYWAVSAVADGSVSEEDLLEPPVYGNKIVASGNVAATAANKDFTAAVSGLTTGGSYYVTAMLVDGRDQRSPIKVTSFTTPDNTVPAFAQGYPVMSKITCEEAQVTVMTTKSCLLYYALLPAGAAAPTPNEFKSAAIPGNLGYGSMSVTKNVTMPFPVNDTLLDEKTDYVLYLWLTDHDGAQSARNVTALRFTTPDETPPIVTDMMQTNCTPNSITMTYAIDEPANLVWAIVTEGSHMAGQFLSWDDEEQLPGNEDITILKFNEDSALLEAKVKLLSGVGALQSSATTNRSPFNITNLNSLDTKTSSYVLYYMANDNATASGNLSKDIKAIRVHTEDNVRPTVSLSFENPDGTTVTPNSPEGTENPVSDADIHIIFSENVKGGTKKNESVFLDLYNKAKKASEDAEFADDTTQEGKDLINEANSCKDELGKRLAEYIKLYKGVSPSRNNEVKPLESNQKPTDSNLPGSWIDWRNAVVQMMDDGSGRVEVILQSYRDPKTYATEDQDQLEERNAKSAIKLESGAAYYFRLTGIYDLAVTPNELEPSPCELPFNTRFAKVLLEPGDELYNDKAPGADKKKDNDPGRIDYHFTATPQDMKNMTDENMRWDMLIWADTSMEVTVYQRTKQEDGTLTDWGNPFKLDIPVDHNEGWAYRSVGRWKGDTANPTPEYGALKDFQYTEYAVHVNKLNGEEDATSWNQTASIRVSIVAGTRTMLSNNVINGSTQTEYDTALSLGVISVGTPDPFTMSKLYTDSTAPDFDRPSISVHDTGARITVMPKKPGQVYYMIIPLENLRNGTTTISNGAELTEDRVSTVDKYDPALRVLKKENNKEPTLAEVPLMSGDPDLDVTPVNPVPEDLSVSQPIRDYFINDRQFPNVIKGTTASVPAFSQATIDLTGRLTYNTVYLVCLMTRGVSSVYSPDIYCYRFTTNMPERPTLTLTNRSNAVVDATVDRTTKVQAALLVSTGLDSTILENQFVDYVRDDKMTEYKKLKPDTPGAPGTDPVPAQYTVLEALRDNYGAGLTNGQYPSMFDAFANEAAKQEIMRWISASSDETIVKAFYPETPVTVPANASSNFTTMQFDRNNLQYDVRYICLAMAGEGAVESHAFRAVYPITLLDDSKPSIQNASANFNFNDDGTKITSGSITINFTRGLYRDGMSTGKKFPVQHLPTPATDVGLAPSDPLGYTPGIDVGNDTALKIATIRNFYPITYIRVNVGETSNTTFSINIANKTFSGESGTSYMDGGNVVVRLDKEKGVYTGNYTITFNGKPI